MLEICKCNVVRDGLVLVN